MNYSTFIFIFERKTLIVQHVNISITIYKKLHPPSFIYMWTCLSGAFIFCDNSSLAYCTGKIAVNTVGCVKHCMSNLQDKFPLQYMVRTVQYCKLILLPCYLNHSVFPLDKGCVSIWALITLILYTSTT